MSTIDLIPSAHANLLNYIRPQSHPCPAPAYTECALERPLCLLYIHSRHLLDHDLSSRTSLSLSHLAHFSARPYLRTATSLSSTRWRSQTRRRVSTARGGAFERLFYCLYCLTATHIVELRILYWRILYRKLLYRLTATHTVEL